MADITTLRRPTDCYVTTTGAREGWITVWVGTDLSSDGYVRFSAKLDDDGELGLRRWAPRSAAAVRVAYDRVAAAALEFGLFTYLTEEALGS